MQKYAAELMGTYFLVFAGTGAIVADTVTEGGVSHVGIALTFGMIVAAMIYSIGNVSGAHINPAVTIAFWLAGRFEKSQVAPYLAAQIFGAILASLTLRAMFPNDQTLGSTLPSISWQACFVMEFLLTALLMFVILRVSREPNEFANMAGAAIGLTVGLEALFAGPLTGASMNPARSIGPALVSMTLDQLWIYVVATTLGAISAIGLDWIATPPVAEPSQSENS